jgi:arsenate reductase-like glutaredoxin family protein
MSLLKKELQKICSQEGINFEEFLNKISKRKNNLPKGQVKTGELFGESEL